MLSRLCSSVALISLAAAFNLAGASLHKQSFSIPSPVQIPGAVLQPGDYSIELTDQLSDRAIVHVSDAKGSDHYFLAVPSKSTAGAAQKLTYFAGASNPRALNAWGSLEAVYPKEEAVKLTAETGKPVVAYDVSYDKLPANLSEEDRKVVTLWLLSPTTVTPDGKGQGVAAAKLQGQRQQLASNQPPKKMPKTATNAYKAVAFGAVLMLIALLFRRAQA